MNLDRPFASVWKTIDHYELQIGAGLRERLEPVGYRTRMVIELLFPEQCLPYNDFHRVLSAHALALWSSAIRNAIYRARNSKWSGNISPWPRSSSSLQRVCSWCSLLR